MYNLCSSTNCSSDRNIFPILEKEYIALDLETTGFSPVNDRIIEFSAVYYVNGEDVDRFTTLIDPGRSVSNNASGVNGITGAMLEGAPKEEDVVWEIAEYIRPAIEGHMFICAHNARFDIGFLTALFERYGIEADLRYVDTLALSRRYFKGLKSYTQPAVADYLDIKRDVEHRAEEDAVVCGTILRRVCEQYRIVSQEK